MDQGELKRFLPGVPIEDFSYTRRERPEHRALRKTFNGYVGADGERVDGVRKRFLTDLAANRATDLRAAGLGDSQISTLSRGRCPAGWNVHHIAPLDDGGTNDFSNLVLMPAHPQHDAIHRHANPQIEGMMIGETRNIKMALPQPGVYGADRSVTMAHQRAVSMRRGLDYG